MLFSGPVISHAARKHITVNNNLYGMKINLQHRCSLSLITELYSPSQLYFWEFFFLLLSSSPQLSVVKVSKCTNHSSLPPISVYIYFPILEGSSSFICWNNFNSCKAAQGKNTRTLLTLSHWPLPSCCLFESVYAHNTMGMLNFNKSNKSIPLTLSVTSNGLNDSQWIIAPFMLLD